MSAHTWSLLDIDQNVYVEEMLVRSVDVAGATSEFSIHKRRLHGGRQDGVDIIEVDNGRFRFTLLPTRGMGIWKAWCDGHELGWQPPVRGPVHPRFVPLSEPSGLGWLDGFDELLVRCGLESNGAPVFADGKLQYVLHGQIANRPAHRLSIGFDPETSEIVIRGEVEESRLFFKNWLMVSTIRTRLNEPGLRISDEIINLASTPGECELMYHVNFGPPLLEAGGKVLVPAARIAPSTPRAAEGIDNWNTYGPPESGFAEQVYFIEPRSNAAGQTQALLHNAAGNLGVSLTFDTATLPRFVVWKCQQDVADGYVTGIEPTTNWPNPRTFESEQGRTVHVAPHESFTTSLQLTVHGDAQSVQAAAATIQEIQGNTPPEVSPTPLAGWSP